MGINRKYRAYQTDSMNQTIIMIAVAKGYFKAQLLLYFKDKNMREPYLRC